MRLRLTKTGITLQEPYKSHWPHPKMFLCTLVNVYIEFPNPLFVQTRQRNVTGFPPTPHTGEWFTPTISSATLALISKINIGNYMGKYGNFVTQEILWMGLRTPPSPRCYYCLFLIWFITYGASQFIIVLSLHLLSYCMFNTPLLIYTP